MSIGPQLIHMNPLKPKSASKILITSTNLRGSTIGTQKESAKLHTFFNLNSDINIVIDSHICESKLDTLKKRHRTLFSKYTVHGNLSKYRGILVLLKKNNGCKITNITNHGSNDTLFFTLTFPDLTALDTLVVYAPSKDCPEFWEKANTIIHGGNSKHKLIIGDFNCTLNHILDQQGYKTDPHPKSRKIINQLLEQEILIDSYRHLKPDTKSFTFRTKDCRKRSRLDYGLISPSLVPYLKNVQHIAHHYENTDHSTVALEIDITNSTIGPGIFRCPPNIHNNINYQILIKNSITKSIFSCLEKTKRIQIQEALFETRIKLYEEYMSLHTKVPNWNTNARKSTLEYTICTLLSNEPTNEELLQNTLTISKPALLEYVLHQMKTDTKTYTKLTKIAEDNTENLLKEELQTLISEDQNNENIELIAATQAQLKQLETKKLYDVLSTKRNYQLLDDERPTKTFLNLESSKAGYSEITRLRIKNPHFNPNVQENATNKPFYEITDTTLIRTELHTTFQDIYKLQPNIDTSPNSLTNFLCSDNDTKPLQELNKRKISKRLANSMEGMLTTDELTHCLFKVMNGSSSPGIDGFTVNYLRIFWEDIKIITTNALNASFGNSLTTTLKKAIIKLLRKGTKDPTIASNYRPISLLSIFYKLASCAITQRIKPAVESVIGRQQKAYIKHNNIGSCIINLINLIRHTIAKKQSGLILLIDFKKAFDSISHSFIHSTLSTLGFGPDIITWISTFLKHREAQILLGGHLTECINLEQGVPQGDVISPYLFIIMVEILLIKITHTKNITGIKYATKESRAETFADDTTLFMERNEENLRNATKYIQQFHNISGLACNIDKTSVIPIGKLDDKNDQICKDLKMVWDNKFTILGFEIDNKLEKLDTNFEKVKEKIKGLIRKWKPYHLSLRGRITIAKTKLVSQMTYVSTVLTPTTATIAELQTLINNFVMGIENNKKHWINKDLIYTHTSKGGIGMIRLETFIKAIKVSWIKRYSIDIIDDNWADIIDNFFQITPDTRHTIHHFGPERFNKIIKANIPVISSLFSAYKTFKHNFPTHPGTMDNSWLNQCAFYNLNITRKLPNSTKRTFLTPTFYGIPDMYHTLTLKDLHPRGTFISNASLNQLTSTNIMNMQYQSFKNHIKAHIGINRKYDAIPLEKLPQKKFTYSKSAGLLNSIKKGSGQYRKIIERDIITSNIHNPSKWKKKLHDNKITSDQVKKAMIHLHSRYIDSTSADHLTRLKLGKTLFNNQLFNIGLIDKNSCNTCTREFNEDIVEDYRHALYQCPAVQKIIKKILSTFFPNLTYNFNISEILISVNTDKHNLYKGPIGQELASLIWDYFQVYIVQCHTAQTTPTSIPAIFEIKSQLNRILKILPRSKLSTFINSSPDLQLILAENTI